MNKTIQLERSVLGAIMLTESSNGISDEVIDILLDLKSVRFTGDHQVIANVIYEVNQDKKSADPLTIIDKLDAKGYPHLMDLVTDLSTYSPSPSTAKHHFALLKQQTLDREVRAIASKVKEVSESRLEPSEKLSKLENLVSNSDVAPPAQMINLGPAAKEWMDRHEQMLNADGEFLRSTGFEGVDQLLDGGVNDNDLIVLGGRPSMGKTQISLAIARHFAINKKQGVAYFSLEMPSYQLLHRMSSLVSGVPESEAKHEMQEHQYVLWGDATKQLVDSPFRILDAGNVSIDTVKQQARLLKRQMPNLGIIIIDYLGLMKIDKLHNSTTENIEEVTKALKNLAKEIRTPILLLSQLNRELERRPNKRPIMSDLRNSGAIEQDADVILFAYRDIKYNENSPWGDISELIVGKSRHASEGTCYYRFNKGQVEHVDDREVDRIKQMADKPSSPRKGNTDDF